MVKVTPTKFDLDLWKVEISIVTELVNIYLFRGQLKDASGCGNFSLHWRPVGDLLLLSVLWSCCCLFDTFPISILNFIWSALCYCLCPYFTRKLQITAEQYKNTSGTDIQIDYITWQNVLKCPMILVTFGTQTFDHPSIPMHNRFNIRSLPFIFAIL